MRLSSLYSFYKHYFGYSNDSNMRRRLIFALAIRDVSVILEQAYETQRTKPIEDYRNREKIHELVLTFLENAEKLALNRHNNPFGKITYGDATCMIGESLLSSRRRGIEIPCPYLLDRGKGDIIFLTFGQAANMKQEIDVLFGLSRAFGIDEPWPDDIDLITYWNLSNGSEVSIPKHQINPVSRESLIDVLNRM